MARKRRSKPQAQPKLWLALVLVAIVLSQTAYFNRALQDPQQTQTTVTRLIQSPPHSSTPTAPAKPKRPPLAQKPRDKAREVPTAPLITPPRQDPPAKIGEQPRLPLPAKRPTHLQPLASVESSSRQRVSTASNGGTVVRWVAPVGEERLVALTFDDGPWPDTLAVLEVLRQYGAKATFFWVGLHLQKRPEIARQVVAEGHAIGNHTWSHRNTPMTPEEASAEIERTRALIQQTTGLSTSLFRPPGGRLYNGLADYALRRGYTVVQWSVLSEDTQAQGATTIVENVLRGVRPGSIVLLHDGGGDRSHTVEALHSILPALQAQGYRFVTVPELLESSQVTLPRTSSN